MKPKNLRPKADRKRARAQSPKEVEKRITVRAAVEKILQIKKQEITPRSLSSYRTYLYSFLEFIQKNKPSDLFLHEVKTYDIIEYLDELILREDISPNTRNNYRRYIGTLFIQMRKRGFVNDNPVEEVDKLITTEKEYRSFTREDYEKVSNYFLQNDLQMWRYCQFIYYGFLRPVDICRHRIENIRMDKRVILVPPTNTKNRKFKPVEITKSLRKVIEGMKLYKYPDHYRVFSRNWQPGEEFLWRNRATEKHREALEKLGLYNGIYDLYSHKHTGNEMALLAGMDVYWIMRQNRHSNLEQTMIYLRGLGVIRPEAQEKDW